MGLEAGGGLAERRRLLERARSRYDDGERARDLRPEIAASWDRCGRRRQPHVASLPPVATSDGGTEIGRELADTPLGRATELIGELGAVAASEGFVAAVFDESGRIVWSDGSPDMRRTALAADFVPGTDWSEQSAGTNAPALAIETGRPATVFAGEHWSDAVHDWVCYAAPVRDARGRTIGALDLSSTWKRASELAGVTVRSLARLVEATLAAPEHGASELAVTDQGERTPDPTGLRIELLGRPGVTLDGRPVHLTSRQIEILAVLALVGPCSLDQLHARVYGDAAVSTTTLKAEVSHLRKAIGGGIGSRPYSIDVPVTSDVESLRASLASGSVTGALELYDGQLLPESESPFLVDERHHLDVRLRTTLLQSGSPSDLLRFAEVHPHDEAIVRAASTRTALDQPIAAEVAAALDRLTR
ncbi:MAG: GAF domain-containing protein [Actinomycetota bacterium]